MPSGISEMSWVVPDLQAAMRHWLDLGYGPFFTMRLDIPDAWHRGHLVPLSLDVGLALADGVQIELIEQRNDGPSAYRDIYGAGEGGFHHVRHRPGDLDRHRERLAASAIPIVMELSFGPQRILYADARATMGCMIEVLDNAPILDALHKMMAKARETWDGSDPIRAVDLMAL